MVYQPFYHIKKNNLKNTAQFITYPFTNIHHLLVQKQIGVLYVNNPINSEEQCKQMVCK